MSPGKGEGFELSSGSFRRNPRRLAWSSRARLVRASRVSADPSCVAAAQVPRVVAPLGTREDQSMHTQPCRGPRQGCLLSHVQRAVHRSGSRSITNKAARYSGLSSGSVVPTGRSCCASGASNSWTPPMTLTNAPTA